MNMTFSVIMDRVFKPYWYWGLYSQKTPQII